MDNVEDKMRKRGQGRGMVSLTEAALIARLIHFLLVCRLSRVFRGGGGETKQGLLEFELAVAGGGGFEREYRSKNTGTG